ncbi:nitroreductase family protein [Lentiprolixibacter aurantiacus]|uniref:Nitroreductase family protein n=1 Tax=Lentiprolixibacter aurantiacus TaxID=2993939 RepID=A0AAE3MMS1_9FLAO|nr:nitroreductase family protein [Lentiprolixibacter aurantiacus]MCX2719707.1 nitroreductase family protein [Lentiprolixibacter aurantiacus]
MEKSVSDAIAYRRSVRIYKDESIDTEKVRKCLENAALAPTSSNLQLWEFYHVVDPEVCRQIAKASFNQPAARTAKQLVVMVVRKDLWRKRAKANLAFLRDSFGHKAKSEYSKREKFALSYYQKLMPSIYSDFLGVLGMIRYLFFNVVGWFRPVYRQVRASDMRVVAHKSAGLAAQNFMISMAAIGYDTCPMEGFDSLRVKKILGLPASAEINMLIGCGIRDESGVYGRRFRVPFETVYKKI